ncbi:hypothetical protein SNE40_013570 [Patella caerulea]|uniref:Uncharacterized protein n=1 Tax=Patella caerulea TaxID=87958 RepID=A0AAN8JFA7_PATCE
MSEYLTLLKNGGTELASPSIKRETLSGDESGPSTPTLSFPPVTHDGQDIGLDTDMSCVNSSGARPKQTRPSSIKQMKDIKELQTRYESLKMEVEKARLHKDVKNLEHQLQTLKLQAQPSQYDSKLHVQTTTQNGQPLPQAQLNALLAPAGDQDLGSKDQLLPRKGKSRKIENYVWVSAHDLVRDGKQIDIGNGVKFQVGDNRKAMSLNPEQ